MWLIGAGRIGTALRDGAAAAGLPCQLVDRREGWDALARSQGEPILVCVRNDDLDEVVRRVPARLRADLVFVQNGALRDALREQSLARCTRGLLYFAVARRGEPIQPGRTSWFCGPHAARVVHWLAQLGLDAEAVDWARFSAYELEKLLWLCVFGPLCQKHGTSVDQIVEAHRAELVALVDELAVVGRSAMGVDVPSDWLVERLCDYSRSLQGYRASVNEWRWRNGWLLQAADRYRKETPLHTAILRQIGRPEVGRAVDP